MASKARMELGRIKRRSTLLEKKLSSPDAAVARKAEAQLAQIAKDLQSWSRKHRVKLRGHTEPQRQGRSRCKATIQSVLIDDVIYSCVLIGKQRRNCLYSCAPKTINPF